MLPSTMTALFESCRAPEWHQPPPLVFHNADINNYGLLSPFHLVRGQYKLCLTLLPILCKCQSVGHNTRYILVNTNVKAET